MRVSLTPDVENGQYLLWGSDAQGDSVYRHTLGHLEYTTMQVSFLTFLFFAFEFELSYFFDVLLLTFLLFGRCFELSYFFGHVLRGF